VRKAVRTRTTPISEGGAERRRPFGARAQQLWICQSLTEGLMKPGAATDTAVHPARDRVHNNRMDSVAAPESNNSYRVLVVDDEAALAGVVANYLRRENFEVRLAHDGNGALTTARELDPDVVVLDIGLPGLDGVEVCRQLRSFSDAYVIMLTARDTEVDKIVGLSVGADNYVTKPCSPRELVARVRAMLRRPRGASALSAESATVMSSPRVFGDLRINVDSREVHLRGVPIMLTRTEFDLLAALSSSPGRVLSRRQLVEAAWGGAWVANNNLVDVHVGNLRRKLGDDPATPRYVTTVRGVGYRMGSG
jgi:DNA-binding response OmpR family regulator